MRAGALQLAHLLRLKAHRAGHTPPSKARLDTLGGIQETVLIYPSPADDPKARRVTTDMTTDQQTLYDLFDLHRRAHNAPTRLSGQTFVTLSLTRGHTPMINLSRKVRLDGVECPRMPGLSGRASSTG